MPQKEIVPTTEYSETYYVMREFNRLNYIYEKLDAGMVLYTLLKEYENPWDSYLEFCQDDFLAKVLIENSIQLERETNSGSYPIHLVFLFSNEENKKLIIDKIKNLECCDIEGYKPIHYLCQDSEEETIEYLLNRNVDIKCKVIPTFKDTEKDLRYFLKKNDKVSKEFRQRIEKMF